MKTKRSITPLGVAVVALALASTTSAQQTPPEVKTLSSLSSTEIAERTVHRRAVEAVIWGMPAVNYDLMLQAGIRGAGGAFNQIVYWSHLPDWKIQTLTPNPDAIYLTPFINTKHVGPMVLDKIGR